MPGGVLIIKYLVLDFNGTIASNGQIISEIKPLLVNLGKIINIYVLTADTFGTAERQCADLPVILHCLQSDNHTAEKGELVKSLGSDNVVAIGNGRNDLEMLRIAKIGIGVLGAEGLATQVWQNADLIVPGIVEGLELLLNPKSLIATLRQ